MNLHKQKFLLILSLGLGFSVELHAKVEGIRPDVVWEYRKHLRRLAPQERIRQVFTWLADPFEPNRWLVVADFAFVQYLEKELLRSGYLEKQQELSLTQRLSNAVPPEASEDLRIVAKAFSALFGGDRSQARAYLDMATRPSSAPYIRAFAYVCMGELTYLVAKDPEQEAAAIERSHYYFQKALDILPVAAIAPAAYVGIARRYFHMRQWKIAIGHLEQACGIDSDFFTAQANLGIIFVEQKQWEKAYVHLQKAYQLRDDDPVVLPELIKVAHVLKKQKHVQDLLTRYLALPNITAKEAMPILEQVLFATIAEYSRAGMVDRALSEYQKLQERFPNVPEIIIRIGMCLRDLHRYGEAQVHLTTYIAARPQEYAGYFELALLYFFQKQFLKAAKQFVTALKLHPKDDGNLWLWTAKTLEELKWYPEAVFVLSKAETQPELDVLYREVVASRLHMLTQKHKLLASEGGVTFASIEMRLTRHQ